MNLTFNHTHSIDIQIKRLCQGSWKMECHFASTMFHSEAHPSHFEVLSEWWKKKRKAFGLRGGRGGGGKEGTKSG